MLGFSIGPLLGGALTHLTGWRVIFWLNALLMLVAIAGMASAGSATMRAHGAQGRRADWVGFICWPPSWLRWSSGCMKCRTRQAAPLPVAGAFVLAAAAFVLLLSVGARAEAPLVDLSFFTRRQFVMGVAIASLSMFSIIGLLLYFNLYAQSPKGFGLTALEAGALLLPLSAALLALAISASAVAARVGLRNAMMGGMALITIASVIIGAATAGGGWSCWESGFSPWAPVWPCLMPRHRGWRCRLFRPRKRDRVQASSTPAPFLAAASALPAVPSRSRSADLSRC